MAERQRIDLRRSWSLTEISHGSKCLYIELKPWLLKSRFSTVFKSSSKHWAVNSNRLFPCKSSFSFATWLASFFSSFGTANWKKLSVDVLISWKKSASVGFGFNFTRFEHILKHIDLVSFVSCLGLSFDMNVIIWLNIVVLYEKLKSFCKWSGCMHLVIKSIDLSKFCLNTSSLFLIQRVLIYNENKTKQRNNFFMVLLSCRTRRHSRFGECWPPSAK